MKLQVTALLLLTAATGAADAVCYLALVGVFANRMTANIVLLGLSFHPQTRASPIMAVTAIGAFMLGAAAGGAVGHRYASSRAWPAGVFATQGLLLVAVALVSIWVVGTRTLDVAPLAFAGGLQNSTVRRMAVADLTTTILTLSLTGLVADSRILGGPGSKASRRLGSVAAMLLGASAGALVLRFTLAGGILLPAGCMLTAAALLAIARRREPDTAS
jgi:uncharacterized membrane protein YoaK (UPF0700 family)